ncbi:hypothetical protein IWW34DRAFT_805311 [Fusarium oxysporum f. sp. albedinis]|nr:hypothetical protein IWW34DRAFT_805311 [Fusarium oxysporum f. sp. albedinis]
MVKSKRIVAALAYLSIIGTASSVTSQSTVSGSFTILPSVTETSGLLVSSETGSATESTTTSSATPEVFCANQIYRGNALSRGYKTIGATDEQECRESCVDDDNRNSWFFQTSGTCNLYTETLPQFSAPSYEESLLIGSRTSIVNVLLEADCAHLCTKNVLYHIWQYDSVSQTCNMFSGSFSDLVTLDSDGTAMAWNNNWIQPYRSFDKCKTVATCARACSIDPMCLSRFVWDGLGDCSLLEIVVFLKVSSILGIFG